MSTINIVIIIQFIFTCSVLLVVLYKINKNYAKVTTPIKSSLNLNKTDDFKYTFSTDKTVQEFIENNKYIKDNKYLKHQKLKEYNYDNKEAYDKKIKELKDNNEHNYVITCYIYDPILGYTYYTYKDEVNSTHDNIK
jgi:hypothetical protein